MRILQIALDKLMCLTVLAAGVLILCWFYTPLPSTADPFLQQNAPTISAYLPAPESPAKFVYIGIGIILTIVGLVTLLPRFPKFGPKRIRFETNRGTVNISLESVSQTLNKVANALPEVKTIKIAMILDQKTMSMNLKGDAVLVKDRARTAQEISTYVMETMSSITKNLLSDDMEVTVEMNVSDIVPGPNATLLEVATVPDAGEQLYLTRPYKDDPDQEAPRGPEQARDPEPQAPAREPVRPQAPPQPKPAPEPSALRPAPESIYEDEDSPAPVEKEFDQGSIVTSAVTNEDPYDAIPGHTAPKDTIDGIILVDMDAEEPSDNQPILEHESADDYERRAEG
jgi:hypothetical protein